jgi:hypothetical protein
VEPSAENLIKIAQIYGIENPLGFLSAPGFNLKNQFKVPVHEILYNNFFRPMDSNTTGNLKKVLSQAKYCLI